MKQSIIILIVLVINTCHAGSHDPHTLAVLQTKAVTTKLSEGTACISSTCNAAADNLQNLIPKAVTSPYSKEQREELICKIISASRRPASYPEGVPTKLTEAEKKALEQQENSLKLLQQRLITELFAPVPIDEAHPGCNKSLAMYYKDYPNFCKDACGACCACVGSASFIGGLTTILTQALCLNCANPGLVPIGMGIMVGGALTGIVPGAACLNHCCYDKPCCDPDFYMLKSLSNPKNWDMTEETSDEKAALLSARDALEN